MASGGYDGSVRIDTTLSPGGFSAGLKKIQAAAAGGLNNILLTALKIGNVIRSVVSGIALIGAAIVGATVAFLHFGAAMIRGLKDGVDEASPLYKLILQLETQFNRVRGAIFALFGTLLQAALPTIIKMVDWLVRMLDILNQIVAALLGQKTVMRVVASSTDAVAAHTAKSAKNTEKMKKAAQGALAAFDQIDVLAKKREEDTAGGGGGLAFDEVPIDQKWMSFADNLKTAFLDVIEKIKAAWARFVEAWKEFWDSPLGELIIALAQNVFDTLSKMWDNARKTFQAVKEQVERILKGITQLLTGLLTGDWRLAWEGLKNIVAGVLGVIFEIVRGNVKGLLILFDGFKNGVVLILNFLRPMWSSFWTFIQALAVGTIRTLQNAWADFSNFFRRVVIDPLRDRFGDALNWIRDKFRDAFEGIGNIARGAFNGLVDVINSILSRIADSINGMAQMANPFSWIFGWSIPTVSAPHIPHLATGAVIPPNSQFLAVLGDQRSGKNIEAPAAMFEEMLNRAVAGGQGKQEITISFGGDLGSLVRALKPYIDKEYTRAGTSLVAGGTTS